MLPRPLSKQQLENYDHDGFITLKSFFTAEEINLLRDTARRDRKLAAYSISYADGAGGENRLALWNHSGNGIYGMFARRDRMVGMVQQILDDEPYHYHSKMIVKEPRVGGAWEWRQDYGYWYQNGALMPDLCSVMIAVDPATKENGCLQVIRASHLIGRIDHKLSGDRASADIERVNTALQRMEHVYCELEPGDCVVFHCNTLHRSDANRSERSSRGMICCYNARSNNPHKVSQRPDRGRRVERFGRRG
jgi:ectoine hydroxylase